MCLFLDIIWQKNETVKWLKDNTFTKITKFNFLYIFRSLTLCLAKVYKRPKKCNIIVTWNNIIIASSVYEICVTYTRPMGGATPSQPIVLFYHEMSTSVGHTVFYWGDRILQISSSLMNSTINLNFFQY